MSGHYHNPTSDSQNVGNSLGSRACVRQSKLYRKYESGNGVKSALGVDHLAWDQDKKQGAYSGHGVWDADAARPTHTRHPPRRTPEEHASYHASGHHNVLAGRAPLSDYSRPEAGSSHLQAREPRAQPPARLPSPAKDTYARYKRRPSEDMPRGSTYADRDAYAEQPTYERLPYEQRSYPDRGYGRSGYAHAPVRMEPTYERGVPATDRPRQEAAHSYAHRPAPEPSRHISMLSGSDGIDAPASMRTRGENENISNFAAAGPRIGYDRDMEYAALNAKVSDVEKRMVLAAKTRPW